MIKTPERFSWAVELLYIQTGDNVLEIGCGAGLLAEIIAGKLLNGQFTGIDKSPTMLQKAQNRNKKFIEAGVSKLITSDFLTSELPPNHYNKIVAFNVNFFWKKSINELRLIKQLLKPEGKIYIFYQAPYEIKITAAELIKQHIYWKIHLRS